MRISSGWKDYELIDASSGERLERWGDIILIRPDPQIVWNTPKKNLLWKEAHARYHRSSSGGGHWETYRRVPDVWQIGYKDLAFRLKPMGFKHTGLFPEQAVNWDWIANAVRSANRKIKVLNLFAYTGGATLASLSAGAETVHVDASKGMVLWAKDNAAASGLADKPVRWLVDDCLKFVAREIRRGNHYDGIVMDPPSYGRGPNGEIWKIEEQIYPLLTQCRQLLSEQPLFFIINSYTTGLSPAVMMYLLETLELGGGTVSAEEIGLPVTETGLVLPCGSTAVWKSDF